MYNRSKKVLVTGVAGFLGSHLAENLANKKHRVVGIDNMMGGYKDNVPKNIQFINGDCCDLNQMNKIMEEEEKITDKITDKIKKVDNVEPEKITKISLVFRDLDDFIFTSDVDSAGFC